MNQETRTCQNCKQEFQIELEDFLFYEKIKVPPPTFCPECRLIRRLAFLDMFRLYKRKCDLCGKDMISRYHADAPYKVYCPSCWWSDAWDPLEFGKDYDFSRPFFEQFKVLYKEVPLLGISLQAHTAAASPYNNHAGNIKDCYLIFDADYNERCAYGYYVVFSRDCMNSSFINSCELCSDTFHAYKNYHGIYLSYSYSNNNSAFLWQCVNCQNCFLSANLRNKQYCIFNKPYTKEEYEAEIKKYDLGSYHTYEGLKKKAREHWQQFPVKTFWYEFSKDVSGLLVFSSKNVKQSFEVNGAEDSKFLSFIATPPTRECYDYTSFGDNVELIYEGETVGYGARNLKFADESGINLYDCSYVKLCMSSSDLFGCIGVRNKSYCILNKQCTKEEYETILPKIIQQMHEMPYTDQKGRIYRYGEFFPIELSSIAYNESLAHTYFPLTKEQTLKEGYSWRDEEPTAHEITLQAKDLPDHIKETPDSVLQEVLGCISCGRAFRLIPQEFAYYRKMNVPLPRQCFFCRLAENMQEQPNPGHWWLRQCQCAGKGSDNGVYQNVSAHAHGSVHCQNKFETWYAPDRPEIVYCKGCYQAEVV